jgi:hypothetical protein
MYYFLRLRKGNIKYSFSGVANGIDYRESNIPGQLDEIDNFLLTTVIKSLYDCEPETEGSCPDFALKSYKWDVNDDESLGTSELLFWIVDIVIGVQD